MDDVVEAVDQDFDLGAHTGFDPVVGTVDGDGGEIDLEVGVHPAVLGIGQHADLGDFTGERLVGEGVDGDAHFLSFLDLLNVGFVDLDLDGNFGHVGDGDDGLAFADGGAFADGLLAAVVEHVLAAAAVNDEAGL